jgi:CheY-like chemotaxis protein
MSVSVGVTGQTASAGLTTSDGRRPRVAIVGGTPSGALVATVLCDQFGCTPLNTRTGESVLALLRRDIPLDMVVMDLMIAHRDVVDADQHILAIGDHAPMTNLALVDDGADPTTTRARTPVFAGTVLNPYSPRELYAAMHTALDAAVARTATGQA